MSWSKQCLAEFPAWLQMRETSRELLGAWDAWCASAFALNSHPASQFACMSHCTKTFGHSLITESRVPSPVKFETNTFEAIHLIWPGATDSISRISRIGSL